MKINLYNSTGEKTGSLDLNPKVFEVTVNEDLMHKALIRQESNARRAVASVKSRADARGGGAKPWRQKGTGRARVGSSRNPIWRGGGVCFGPKSERNFTKAMPKKQRRLALFSALSVKAKDESILALEKYEDSEIKTKNLKELLDKLPINRNVLIILPEKNEIIEKSVSNLPNAKTLLAQYLNIHDLLKYRTILFLKESFNKIEELYLKD